MKTSQREFEHVFLQGDSSTREDQLKQKHNAEMWTSLTEGQEGRYGLKSEVGDQRLQRVDA